MSYLCIYVSSRETQSSSPEKRLKPSRSMKTAIFATTRTSMQGRASLEHKKHTSALAALRSACLLEILSPDLEAAATYLDEAFPSVEHGGAGNPLPELQATDYTAVFSREVELRLLNSSTTTCFLGTQGEKASLLKLNQEFVPKPISIVRFAAVPVIVKPTRTNQM